MLLGKYINGFYKKYWYFFLIGVIALIVVDVTQTFLPRFLGRIIDDGNLLINDVSELGSIIGWIMLCAVIMFVGRFLWRISIFRASTGIAASLRRKMFEKAEKLSPSYYHENKVGNIMNWFTTDIEEVEDFMGWGTVMIIDAIFLSASVIVSMVRLNIYLTIMALVPLLLIVVWGALVDRFMSKMWEARQKDFDRLYDFAQENFTGIRVIKSFVKQTMEIHAFAKIAKQNKHMNIKFARVSVLFDIFIEIILAVEITLLIGFGGYFVYCASPAIARPVVLFGQEIQLTVGTLIEFVGYFDLIIWPMIAMGQIVSMKSRAKGSLRRISAFLDTPIEINTEGGVEISDPQGCIEFKDFTFLYPGSKRAALSNVSLRIEPGEHIGIVGKVGSGKTTLANILFRLYNIDEGRVFIDGVDLMEASVPSVRSVISYAPQDNFLFSDTITNNIAFSSESPNAEEVRAAAAFADVASNIDAFPNGYDTVSGERGVTLSGGQKQRVSIARAYYRKSPILVLDDCVSAVDLKTEETILANIKKLREGQTTLLIASRVSSVIHMDKIIVLNDGKVDAFGTHEQCMKQSELYARMVFLQELEKEVEGGAS